MGYDYSFDKLWEMVNYLLKPNGDLLQQLRNLTSALVMSNTKMFKYELIWDKQRTSNPMLAKVQPMKTHENILIFGNGIYNPQFTERKIKKP